MRSIFKHILVLVHFICCYTNCYAQKDSINDISALIYLDSFVVTASRQGFDTKDFIELVRTDDSFFNAFNNLRFASYTSSNEFTFYN